MTLSLHALTLVVRDYDDAIAYFTRTLGFALVEDTPLSPEKRWVVVAPPNGGARLLLARAATAEQESRIGDQTGGRVFLFLHTDDFDGDYATLRAAAGHRVGRRAARHTDASWCLEIYMATSGISSRRAATEAGRAKAGQLVGGLKAMSACCASIQLR